MVDPFAIGYVIGFILGLLTIFGILAGVVLGIRWLWRKWRNKASQKAL